MTFVCGKLYGKTCWLTISSTTVKCMVSRYGKWTWMVIWWYEYRLKWLFFVGCFRNHFNLHTSNFFNTNTPILPIVLSFMVFFYVFLQFKWNEKKSFEILNLWIWIGYHNAIYWKWMTKTCKQTLKGNLNAFFLSSFSSFLNNMKHTNWYAWLRWWNLLL